MPEKKPEKNQGPKTSLDEKFLALASQVMKARGITSDRAISQELDRHPDFINRIRRGLQSATPGAWDSLFAKYPEAQSITTTNVMAQGGQAVGTVHGDNHYSPTSLEACQLELEQHKRDLAAARGEVERLQQQVAAKDDLLAAKDALIASKDDTINLLRASYNRPN